MGCLWSRPVKAVATEESLECPRYLEQMSEHANPMVVDSYSGMFKRGCRVEGSTGGLHEG
jgi:hypothetical protein